MASPSFANADVPQDHAHSSSPPPQPSNQAGYSSHPPTPNAHQSQPSSFPFYPQDHQHDGQPLGEETQHHDQHSQGHPNPAELLVAQAAQMAQGAFPSSISFPPGTVPVAYFAGPHGGIIAIPQLKHKRRQVKNACTNCQKACKKCDEERPCSRCVKYGIDKDCTDSQRKERKKGIKRGPYKKRDPKAVQDEADAAAMMSPENAAFQAMAAAGGVAIYPYGGSGGPVMAQGIKGTDGSFTYPTQYFIPPPNMPQHPEASGSGEAGSSSQQQQPQPVQYYNPLYGHYPPSHGFFVPPGGGPSGSGHMPSDGQGGPSGANPMYALSPANNDDPIERGKPSYAQPSPLADASSTGGVVNVGASVDNDVASVGEKSPKGKGKPAAVGSIPSSPASPSKKGAKRGIASDDKGHSGNTSSAPGITVVALGSEATTRSDKATGATS